MAKKKAQPEAEVADEAQAAEHHEESHAHKVKLVKLVRDDVDEKGLPVSPTTADVHPSEVQNYLDANVGWHHKE